MVEINEVNNFVANTVNNMIQFGEKHEVNILKLHIEELEDGSMEVSFRVRGAEEDLGEALGEMLEERSANPFERQYAEGSI